MASQSGCFANSAVAIVPSVTVEVSPTGKPVVNCTTSSSDVMYSLEVSVDNKSFVPVTVLKSANLPYTDTTKTVGATPLFYRVIAL